MFLKRLQKSVNDRGIGAYLALAFSGMSILLTVLLAEVLEEAAIEEVKASIGHGLAEVAHQASVRLDRSMYERYREIKLLSQRPDLLSGTEDDVDERRATLDARMATYPYYAWIGLVDTRGKVLLASHRMLEGADVSQRPWFGNALKGVNVGDVHEAKLLAKLLPSQDSEPQRFVDIAFPIAGRNGEAQGVIGVHLSWQWARDVEQSILEPIARRRKVDLLIVDREGKALLGPAGLQGQTLDQGSVRRARGAEGYEVETWPDGRSYLVGFSPTKGHQSYPGLGWSVLVRADVDEAFAPVRRIRQRVMFWGIAIALSFSALGLLLARRITRPLWGLARAAQGMQRGEAVAIPAMDRSYFEVRSLAGSLQSLVSDLMQKTAALRELNLTLEQRVERRTHQLEQALAAVRANERRIQAIIESAQDAFVAIDMEGKVYEWSSQAEKTFGWRREEVLGLPLEELVLPQRYRSSLRKSIAMYRQTGTAPGGRMERLVIDRSGREFPVELTVSLGGASDGYFFGAFLHDISDRKKVEQMKNEFISTVSHELRTPLTSIRGSLSMLASGIAGELPGDARELIDISYQSCERLVRLVNDVLDVEKIASGNMTYHMQHQPLLPMLRQAIDAIEGYATQYGVDVRLAAGNDQQPGGGDAIVRIDADRMIQVMTNLLSNAIKFSPSGAIVDIDVERKDGRVRIAVRDQGSGIPDEFRDRIFGKFAQADATDSRKKGGTGLGLNICKSIVEAHGGTIGFDSVAGQGTTFEVSLPLGG
ncbi:ATP-binding protein [Noviherbaspirillum galbum]|uniref:histidine kinase n=1 Tax=Noviherbaspirillum galbum TaxID=2709383 RepID=A0A6B3SRR3_9BURK|nr:ATP-binding protein [Noviherbaspirillum galbum]NEX60339.1 PAS domain S-box protein [Noviherbaspirillum galbum]